MSVVGQALFAFKLMYNVIVVLSYFQITNIGTTEFCQGRTMRWGLAWSFDATLKFPVGSSRCSSSNMFSYH